MSSFKHGTCRSIRSKLLEKLQTLGAWVRNRDDSGGARLGMLWGRVPAIGGFQWLRGNDLTHTQLDITQLVSHHLSCQETPSRSHSRDPPGARPLSPERTQGDWIPSDLGPLTHGWGWPTTCWGPWRLHTFVGPFQRDFPTWRLASCEVEHHWTPLFSQLALKESDRTSQLCSLPQVHSPSFETIPKY